MKTLFDVADVITKIEHPFISHSLTDLGMLADIFLEDNTVELTFVFPFLEIPIAADLISSIETPIREMGLDFKYSIRTMDAEDKSRFMKMEQEGWKDTNNDKCEL